MYEQGEGRTKEGRREGGEGKGGKGGKGVEVREVREGREGKEGEGRKERGRERMLEGPQFLNRWDKTKESLASTLHVSFPEIFPKTESPPIPENPPASITVLFSFLGPYFSGKIQILIYFFLC
jgi:hypothetical protein